MTYSDELTLTQTAIAEILQFGQSVSILGRTLTRANLKDLYEREGYLRIMVARSNITTGSVSYGVPHG